MSVLSFGFFEIVTLSFFLHAKLDLDASPQRPQRIVSANRRTQQAFFRLFYRTQSDKSFASQYKDIN